MNIDPEKLALIHSLLQPEPPEDAVEEVVKEDGSTQLLRKGNYYGGVYNGIQGQKKLMYSDTLINALSLEKLEKLIKSQAGL